MDKPNIHICSALDLQDAGFDLATIYTILEVRKRVSGERLLQALLTVPGFDDKKHLFDWQYPLNLLKDDMELTPVAHSSIHHADTAIKRTPPKEKSKLRSKSSKSADQPHQATPNFAKDGGDDFFRLSHPYTPDRYPRPGTPISPLPRLEPKERRQASAGSPNIQIPAHPYDLLASGSLPNPRPSTQTSQFDPTLYMANSPTQTQSVRKPASVGRTSNPMPSSTNPSRPRQTSCSAQTPAGPPAPTSSGWTTVHQPATANSVFQTPPMPNATQQTVGSRTTTQQIESPTQTSSKQDMSMQAMSQRKNQLPKSITFDGKGNWRSFIYKFTSFADFHGWSEEERKRRLTWSLEGKAGDVFIKLLDITPELTYSELLNKMKMRFGKKEMRATHELEFDNAKQGPQETNDAWYQRLMDIAMEAFPDSPDDHFRRVTVKKFCSGLNDRDAAMHCMNKEPDDLTKALEIIQRYQHTHHMIYGRRRDARQVIFSDEVDQTTLSSWDVGKVSQARRRQGAVPSINQDNQSDGSSSRSSLEERLAQLEHRVNQVQQSSTRESTLEQRIAELEKKIEERDATITRLCATVELLKKGQRRAQVCFNCNNPGHFAQNCPAPCKICRQAGHAYMACPQKRQGASINFVDQHEELNDWGAEFPGDHRPLETQAQFRE